MNKIFHGKMEHRLKELSENLADAIVTDPPYGISFMGKHWDYKVPSVEQWKEAYRVLKPGGYLLAFGGTRTYHRMVVNIEDAGFEIRDQMQWIYGTGFPKSMDISKAIDKSNGTFVEGELSENSRSGIEGDDKGYNHSKKVTLPNPQSEEAKEWEGWGTALKPANEPICVARKPIEGTVADNILKYGTGGINIDDCRIPFNSPQDKSSATWGRGTDITGGNFIGATNGNGKTNVEANNKGRFPSNVIMDAEAGAILDNQTGILTSGNSNGFVGEFNSNIYGKYANNIINPETAYGDSGGASRFFYCPKPDGTERDKGLKGFEGKYLDESRKVGSAGGTNPRNRGAEKKRHNNHPTVKPIDLMRYLVRLVVKKGGIVLDPFCGSGPTLIAAKMELMEYIGIDMEEENVILSTARVNAWNPEKYIEQTLF